MKQLLYALLRLMNDLGAIAKGRAGERLGRRTAGKITAKALNKMFRK
jgi:hypothetical protein